MFKKLLALAGVLSAFCASASAQGPVILMGIDAEDGGPGGHGPITAYEDVIGNGIVPNVSNGGSGLLVIGGGKNALDSVTQWWDLLAADLGLAVTYVNGAANITAQSFSGFAVIGIASSVFETPSGGLTDAENQALTGRAAGIASHVNGGGGLFGTSQEGLTTPYGYLGTIGAFTFNFPAQFDNVTATPEGEAVGITDTNLDVCCWHDEYLTFPGFLDVLATNNATTNACAIGGVDVIIVQGIALTPLFAVNPVGTDHTVTASVADSQGNPVVGTTVTFEIVSGPHAGLTGMEITDANGQCEFTWTGTMAGVDEIVACFIDNMGDEVCSEPALKEWIEVCFELDFQTEDDFTTALVNGQDVSTPPEFGTLVAISGAGPNVGAAIFDSDPAGPNAAGEDPDLLVDCGNVLILQNNGESTQTVAGFFDEPDDDEDGGTLSFVFLSPVSPGSLDLIDIDAGAREAGSVVLTDTSNRTRTYTIPPEWTGDTVVDGNSGKQTLDLTRLVAQPGYGSTATAEQEPGFDANDVISIDVNLGSSAAVDNLKWCTPGAPATHPRRHRSPEFRWR